MKDATKIFKRHEGGPLLHVKDFPGKAQIYNPAPVQCGDETILLVSVVEHAATKGCLLYTSPSPRDGLLSRMPSSA